MKERERDNTTQCLTSPALGEDLTDVVSGGSLQDYHLSQKKAENITQHHTSTRHGLRKSFVGKRENSPGHGLQSRDVGTPSSLPSGFCNSTEVHTSSGHLLGMAGVAF